MQITPTADRYWRKIIHRRLAQFQTMLEICNGVGCPL